jgi:hypothetical protein
MSFSLEPLSSGMMVHDHHKERPEHQGDIQELILPTRDIAMCFQSSCSEADLDDSQDVWQRVDSLIKGAQQHKKVVRRRIRHHEQVVGGVAVVRCHKQRHHALQEGLGRLTRRITNAQPKRWSLGCACTDAEPAAGLCSAPQ